MHWIFVALIPPIIWSVINHADKYLVSKYAHHSGPGGLAVYSSIFAIFVIPVIFLIDQDVTSISFWSGFGLACSGLLIAVAITFYLYALDRDDASHVVPFWFLIPVFAYVLGFVFLGESLESIKIIGAAVTLVGAILLSLEFDEGVKVKMVTALLMVASGLCIALSETLFKGLTETSSFWQSAFWNQVGMVFFGLFCIAFVAPFRRDFLRIARVRTAEVVTINVAGETGQTIATAVSYYSVLLAPLSLVLLMSYTFQPLFVFIEGIIITRFFPKIAQEKLSRRHIYQKLGSIVIMCIGVYMIIVL